MNKYINDNWRAVVAVHGPKALESLGLILHGIFSHAATTVPYKELFNDTD